MRTSRPRSRRLAWPAALLPALVLLGALATSGPDDAPREPLVDIVVSGAQTPAAP